MPYLAFTQSEVDQIVFWARQEDRQRRISLWRDASIQVEPWEIDFSSHNMMDLLMMDDWLEEPTNCSVPFAPPKYELPQRTVPGALLPNNTERDPNPRRLMIISDSNKENLPPATTEDLDEDLAAFEGEMELVSEDEDDDEYEDSESTVFEGVAGVNAPSPVNPTT